MIGVQMGFTISSPVFGFVPVKIQTQEPELVYMITNLRNNLSKIISLDSYSVNEIEKIYNFYSNLKNYSINMIRNKGL